MFDAAQARMAGVQWQENVPPDFLPVSEFVVKNADYLDWDAFGFAIAGHIRYRNESRSASLRARRARRGYP